MTDIFLDTYVYIKVEQMIFKILFIPIIFFDNYYEFY